MSESHEMLEHMEHAGHAEHHDHGHGDGHKKGEGKKSIARYVGMTMAVLGVMLALCSAMLGGTRTELIAVMVQQNSVRGTYLAVASKYRTIIAELRGLHAFMQTDPEAAKKAEANAKKIESETDGTPQAPVIRFVAMKHDEVMGSVIPTPKDVLDNAKTAREYREERAKAMEWAESYEDAVKAHEHAAEHYEWAQLCAEFGIVLASIALLLGARPAWFGACGLGIASLAIIGWTYSTAHGSLVAAEHKIEEARNGYLGLNTEEKQEKEDDSLIADCEKTNAAAEGDKSDDKKDEKKAEEKKPEEKPADAKSAAPTESAKPAVAKPHAK